MALALQILATGCSSHEGVVNDDVYFARFHDMTYAPVKDDPLSRTLPTIPQTQ